MHFKNYLSAFVVVAFYCGCQEDRILDPRLPPGIYVPTCGSTDAAVVNERGDPICSSGFATVDGISCSSCLSNDCCEYFEKCADDSGCLACAIKSQSQENLIICMDNVENYRKMLSCRFSQCSEPCGCSLQK